MWLSRSQLSHFLFLWTDPFFTLNEEQFTFHLQYKHSGTFSNRKNEKLSNPPQNPKMFDPTLVTLLRMRTRHSQSSRENGTSSSGTSPLASYKEVSPPPPYPGATLWNCNLPKTKALITVTSWLKSASPKQWKRALKKVLDSWRICRIRKSYCTVDSLRNRLLTCIQLCTQTDVIVII